MSHSGSGQSSSEASAESSGGPVRLSKSDFGRKHRKIVRILTVVAYIVSVSTAAVLLSAYYVFLWKPTKPNTRPTDTPTTMAMASPQTSAYVGLPSGLPLISFATAASQSLPFSSSSSSNKHLNSQRPHMSSTLLHHHGHGSISSSDRAHSPQPPTPQSFFMQKLLENITDPPFPSSSPTPSNDTFNFNNTNTSSETMTILTPKTTADQLTTTATATTTITTSTTTAATTTTINATTKAPSLTTATTPIATTDPITTTRARSRRSTLKPAKKASTFKSSSNHNGMFQPTTPHSSSFNEDVNTKKNNTLIH